MKKLDAESVIDRLNLAPHPEGGAFRETFRALASADDGRKRSAATLIYFLLRRGDVLAWHRVKGSDEIFLYHAGDPYLLRWIDSERCFHDEPVGADLENGELPQRLAPANCWQAANIDSNGEYGFSLVACMVSPGFDFDDFEMPSEEKMAGLYPDLAERLAL